MATENGEFLVQAATYLGAAAVAVPVFNRLKLGFDPRLSRGGRCRRAVRAQPSPPGGRGLPRRGIRASFFSCFSSGSNCLYRAFGRCAGTSSVWAAAQMAATGALIASLFVLANVLPWRAAVVAGLSLAFSSTAFALQFMKDRGELTSDYGRRAFPILLFQDLAVVPLLAVVPFLAANASTADAASAASGWIAAAKAAGVLAGLFVLGTITPSIPCSSWSPARDRARRSPRRRCLSSPASVSPSPGRDSRWRLALSSAGVLLAESSYRHQIETDIEPFSRSVARSSFSFRSACDSI